MSLQYSDADQEPGKCWWRGLHLLCDHSNKVCCRKRICSFLPTCLLWHPGSTQFHQQFRFQNQNQTEEARQNAEPRLVKSLQFFCLYCFLVMFEVQRWLLPALEGLGHSQKKWAFETQGTDVTRFGGCYSITPLARGDRGNKSNQCHSHLPDSWSKTVPNIWQDSDEWTMRMFRKH